MKRKIYVVGKYPDTDYANWMKGEIVDEMEDADLVVFTGGEDVSPQLYGEKKGNFTSCNLERDLYEQNEFGKAKELNKHMIGICRGSQFLCVMAGGRLVQHQTNAYSVHPIVTEEGKFKITSTHHQAQFPYDMQSSKYKVLGWTEAMSVFHFDGDNKEISNIPFKEVEIAYYPEIKALAIQGHPEFPIMEHYGDTIKYLQNLLTKHLKDSI